MPVFEQSPKADPERVRLGNTFDIVGTASSRTPGAGRFLYSIDDAPAIFFRTSAGLEKQVRFTERLVPAGGGFSHAVVLQSDSPDPATPIVNIDASLEGDDGDTDEREVTVQVLSTAPRRMRAPGLAAAKPRRAAVPRAGKAKPKPKARPKAKPKVRAGKPKRR